MKKLILGVAATLMFAASASADILALPNSGNFVDNTTQSFTFDFPPNGSGVIESINSISIDLTHTWAGDVEIRLITPGGGTFSLADNSGGSGDLGGTYTFVESGGSAPWSGLTGSAVYPSGEYNAFTWLTGPFDKNGWTFEFQDNAGGDQGTWSNIVIDFNKGTVIPEPTSALVILGAAGLAIFRRRR